MLIHQWFLNKMDREQILLKQRDIGFKLADLVSTDAYKFLELELNQTIDALNAKLATSNDPNEVFACIKEKNGISLFIDTAKRLIDDGLSADRQLASMKRFGN